MGSNQVKATPSPFIPVESRALSYYDDQERIIKKGKKRRLGKYVLSKWILMKRRERELVKRAQEAVNEGKAPLELLKEIEMSVTKDTARPRVRYHPTILAQLPKTKPRLKGPKLTQTAARRIQESYERREREMKEASASESSLRSRSRVSIRSHGWTTDRRRPTAKSQASRRQKRASSLPPSSTLSLLSVTTAESSGIGLSRASSMTSVASTRHRTFYTRQRVSRFANLA